MRENRKEIPAILVAGGRPRDPQVMTRMMAQGFEGIEKPIAAYIGTANKDNPAFFHVMKAILKSAGAKKVNFVHLAREKTDLEKAKKALNDSDVIFLSGGEVEDGMNWLKKHGLVDFLKSLYKAGKRFMGVSAGVIMMGTHWVRWDIPENDDTSELFDCLGIIPVLFDVHGEDEDWVELKAAVKLLGPGSRGYGLVSGSMIRADSRGTLENLSKEYLVFENEGGKIRVL